MKRYIKPFEILQPDKIPEKVDDLDEIVDVKVSKLQLIRINRLLQNYNKHQEVRKKIKVEIKRMIISLIAISLAAVGGLSAIILHLKNSSCKTKFCSCLFQEQHDDYHHHKRKDNNNACPTT